MQTTNNNEPVVWHTSRRNPGFNSKRCYILLLIFVQWNQPQYFVVGDEMSTTTSKSNTDKAYEIYIPTKDGMAEGREAGLKRQNELRAQHGSPPLVLDDALNESAQQWAEKMAKTGFFGHNNNNQNCWKGYGTASPGMEARVLSSASNAFYHEICRYTGGRYAYNTGHFTTLVWDSATKLGFGLVLVYDYKKIIMDNGKVTGSLYAVFNYGGAGNKHPYGNYFTNNVKRPLDPHMVWEQQKCKSTDMARFWFGFEPYPPLVRTNLTSLTAAREAALKRHNEFRAQHGVPPLELDDKLNEQAQLSVENKITPGGNGYNRTKYPDTVEFEFEKGPIVPVDFGPQDCIDTVLLAINSWYHEVCEYEVGGTGRANHFSQIVWASANTVGFGLAMEYIEGKTDGKLTFVVLYNSTQGRHSAAYRRNVKPAINPDEVWKQENCLTKAAGRYFLRQEPYPVTIPTMKPTEKVTPKPLKVIKSVDSSSLTAGREAALKRHNELRAQHGLPPVTLDDKLNEQAQLRAEDKILPGTNGYNKSNYPGTGEIFFYDGGPLIPIEYGSKECIDTVLTAIGIWYHEICDYVEGEGHKLGSGVQRFSQVVWASVETVGFGLSMGYVNGKDKGKISFVAVYQRSALTLYASAYAENVKPVLNPDDVWKQEHCSDNSKGRAYLHH